MNMTLATCLFTALTFTRTYGMYTIRDKKKMQLTQRNVYYCTQRTNTPYYNSFISYTNTFIISIVNATM